MRAAVLEQLHDLRPQTVPTPSPGPGEVLVKVGANTICGTDLRITRGEKTSYVELPVVLGHETAGHVAAVGEGVEGYETGAPVAMCPAIPCRRCWECRHDLENVCSNLRIMGYSIDGGMAEYMLVPAFAVEAGCLFVAEADAPSEQLALAEPLSCVVTGQRWTPTGPGDTVLILGAGPIGLLHLQLSLLSGARSVIVSQRSEGRRSVALALGASVAVDPSSEDLAAVVAEATGGVGVDVTYVCVGVPELAQQALELSRTGGRVCLFAGFKGDGSATLAANLLHYKQVLMSGTSNTRRADFETALGLIATGRIDLAPMITHRFGIDAVQDAIAAMADEAAIKVALTP